MEIKKITPQQAGTSHASGVQFRPNIRAQGIENGIGMQLILREPRGKRLENKTWANLMGNNRFGLRGMNLNFVAPILQNGKKWWNYQRRKLRRKLKSGEILSSCM